MQTALAVAAGGALGAVARYGVVRMLQTNLGFPWGVLVGAFLLGGVVGLFAIMPLTKPVMMFVSSGLLGGFTTFSAFIFDIVMLVQQGRLDLAAAYAVLSIVAAIGALLGGVAVSRALLQG